jgi:hypothetical protein
MSIGRVVCCLLTGRQKYQALRGRRMTRRMTEAKFETDDAVRFIATETLFTVTKCHQRMHEYQIQPGDKTTDQAVGARNLP